MTAQHPEVVDGSKHSLGTWHEAAVAARVEPEADAEMNPEEIQRLRALGYIQ